MKGSAHAINSLLVECPDAWRFPCSRVSNARPKARSVSGHLLLRPEACWKTRSGVTASGDTHGGKRAGRAGKAGHAGHGDQARPMPAWTVPGSSLCSVSHHHFIHISRLWF